MSQKYLTPNYSLYPFSFEYGKGCHLYTKEGGKYLDLVAGVAVNSLGYAHPEMLKTIREQSEKLIHVGNIYGIKEQQKLAQKLCKITGYEKTFFCNSGTEANEAAMKLARKHTGKTKIIAFDHSFHGRTMGTLSITDKKKIQDPFRPLVPDCQIIPFNDKKALEEAVDDNTAAIFLEFLQGEGGVNPIDEEFLKHVFSIAKSRKTLVVADEVQTGAGRTGTFLASEQFDVKPDITTMAKGLAGGLPIGAILTTEEIGNSFDSGSHGSTFGGNPLVCTVSHTVVSEITKPSFLDNIRQNSKFLFSELEKIAKSYPQLILKIRGLGLMVGIEVVNAEKRDELIKKLQEQKVLIFLAGDKTLRLIPPLIIDSDEINQFLTIFKNVVKF